MRILTNYLALFSLCRVGCSASKSVNCKIITVQITRRSSYNDQCCFTTIELFNISLLSQSVLSLAFSERFLSHYHHLMLQSECLIALLYLNETYGLHSNNTFAKQLLFTVESKTDWWLDGLRFFSKETQLKYEISYLFISHLVCYLTPHCNGHRCLQMSGR